MPANIGADGIAVDGGQGGHGIARKQALQIGVEPGRHHPAQKPECPSVIAAKRVHADAAAGLAKHLALPGGVVIAKSVAAKERAGARVEDPL